MTRGSASRILLGLWAACAYTQDFRATISGNPERRSGIDPPRKYEILGGERLAVLPAQICPELERRLHFAIAEHLPAVGVQRGQSADQKRLW